MNQHQYLIPAIVVVGVLLVSGCAQGPSNTETDTLPDTPEDEAGNQQTDTSEEQDTGVEVNLAGWLPATHHSYWQQYNDSLEIAGINVNTTWLGLAVPAYVDEEVQSLNDLATQKGANFKQTVDGRITGIDKGAGVMQNTEDAMGIYNLNTSGWELKASSEAAMMGALNDAVDSKEPIIVTLWEPHAAFSITDLRKLKDPENVYNAPDKTRQFLSQYAPRWQDAEVQSDVIASVVEKGFKEESPAAYEFLTRFNIPAATQSDWIFQYNEEDKQPLQIAETYVQEHQEKVDQWTPENAELGAKTITIGIPPWSGVTVKSRVAKVILEDMGYDVTIEELNAGVVYRSMAQ